MQREAQKLTIADLRQIFVDIEFPEYQREPTVWNRDQKQRLIDSILRSFDIAAIYFYHREDGGLECIDGRQRLNAIMAFLGDNPTDEDNGFGIRIQNEVTDEGADDLAHLDGKTFAELDQLDDLGATAKRAVLDYEVIMVFLSGSHEPSEFNLQFLRLNLGTLINAGEKLHAMVGVMRDLLFERLGQHPFLARVGVPTRRYARELIAAQIMLEVSAKAGAGEFARARHFDLQRYVKFYSEYEDPNVSSVTETLDALQAHATALSEKLGNRAICVSVVLAGWELGIREDPALATQYGEFIELFLDRLAEQVRRMKEFNVDQRYDYLVTFQRHLTQAAVEKAAITFRDEILRREFAVWQATGGLTGDAGGAQ